MGSCFSKPFSTEAFGGDSRATRSGSKKASLSKQLQISRAKHLTTILNLDQRPSANRTSSTDLTSGQSGLLLQALDVPRKRVPDFKVYDFGFENLVFEGGGNKGMAYAGAIQFLEDHGLLSNIKRFAGSSAGALVAALLASGHTPQEIQTIFFDQRTDKLFLDAPFGVMSLIPGLITRYGWHPGLRIYKWYGERLKDKLGNPDVTFQDLYRETGRELCIVVTNLTQMTTQYCHPKTTPDMPIRLAMRMSMSIPGHISVVMFAPIEYSFTACGIKDIVVDGGMICNYPIHCFDGWYLSMKPEDAFVRRLKTLYDIPFLMRHDNRFASCNHKTLGVLLISENESDVMRKGLEDKYVCHEPPNPSVKTKLFADYKKVRCQRWRAEKEHKGLVKAIDAFLGVLKKYHTEQDGKFVIYRREMEAAFQDTDMFSEEQAQILFGQDFTVSQVFSMLDKDEDGHIELDELVRFVENTGMDLQSLFLGYQRQHIDGLKSFISSLHNTLIYNVGNMLVKEFDFERSVAINTGYVDTTDFQLEKADIQFLHDRGYNSMRFFLQWYMTALPERVHKKEA